MLSRAHLLIEKEIKKLNVSPPWGIEIKPVNDDNIFEWTAKVKGLKNTPWEGGIFQIYIKFDEHFHERPPQVIFQTIPFHPNVDMRTGRPCIDFLDNFNLWHPSYSLNMILVTVQTLLSNPSMENAINLEALKLMRQSPHTYQQLILECVKVSQQIDAGNKIPMYPDYKAKTANGTDGHRHCTAQSHVTKLSFNDYLLTWQSIATTKPRENIQNQLHQLQERYPQLQKIHLGLTKEEVQEQMKGQMEEYHQLMYGSFTRKVKDGKERSATLARIQQMRKIYLPPRHSSAAHEHSSAQLLDSGITTHEGVDEWEKEVDDLVLWTDKLDAAAIDT